MIRSDDIGNIMEGPLVDALVSVFHQLERHACKVPITPRPVVVSAKQDLYDMLTEAARNTKPRGDDDAH